MQIRPTNNVQTARPIELQTQNTTEQTTNSGSLPVDQLDISAEAQMLSNTQSSDGIRMDKVADIRAQIAQGNYDTPEKLDAAVSRMLDEYI